VSNVAECIPHCAHANANTINVIVFVVLAMCADSLRGTVYISLYMILSLPILYGVWHIKGESGRAHILRKSRAMVLQ